MVTPDEMAAATEASPSEAAADTTAKVDFVDEDPRTATDKIVADKNTDMPEDVSIVAAFQNALDKQRQARDARGGTPAPAPTVEEKPSTSPGDLPTPEARLDASNKLVEENKRELDAYLRALTETENPALKPKPSEFFNAPGGKGGTLTPPPQTPVAATAASVPAAGMAGNVMAEPSPQPDVPQIRALGDFDVSMFTPQEERIRIPKGVRPRIAAAEFPPLEVLSFVPNYGVVAARQGREGVLLIGERLEGWELISVSDAYAEFRLGERKHTVTLDNANRQP
jgi:hypothetical protein